MKSHFYSPILSKGKPNVIVWVTVYCWFQAVTSFVPAMLILLFPSVIDYLGAVFSLGAGNFYYWAIVQAGEAVLYFLIGILCLQGSIIGWCSIMADPASTIVAVFMLGSQTISGFGPYDSWVINKPWYSWIIFIIYVVNMLIVPYSFIAAIALTMKEERRFFKLDPYLRCFTCLTITTLLFTVVTIFEVSSWGDILGASRMKFFWQE